MLPSTLATYGGPFLDEAPVDNPETQQSADKANRALEDTAEMTLSAPRSWVEFLTNTTGNPTAGDVTHASVWGTGSTNKPVVTRTGVGRYTITCPASYTDALGDSVPVNIVFARASVRSDSDTDETAKVRTVAANVVTVVVLDAAQAPSDLAGTSHVLVEMR